MQFAHSCYVVSAGVLAMAFPLDMIAVAFGDASFVPLFVVLYLDAAVVPMTCMLFMSLVYRALYDNSPWILDAVADTYIVVMVPIAIAHSGATLARVTGVAITPLSEKLGLATLGFFFTAAFIIAVGVMILGSILLLVQVTVHNFFDE